MREPSRSVRGRLLRWLLGPLLLVLAASVAIDYAVATRALQRANDHALENLAYAIGGPLDGHSGEASAAKIEALLRLNRSDTRWYLAICNGTQLSGDLSLAVRSASNDPNPLIFDAMHRGQHVRELIYRAKTGQGPCIITVAQTKLALNAARRDALVAALATNGVQLLLTLLIVWLGVRLGLSALLDLRDRVAARGRSDISPLSENSVPDEARPLVRALNLAIAHAAEGTTARQQFVADAAHQLRQPLASLQGGLELLVRDVSQTVYRERALVLLSDSRRLSRTTHQLLAMAQADALPLAESFTRIDLRQLVADNAERAFDRALKRRIDLGIEAPSTLVEGSSWLLNEALANLIANALAHTPDGGRITVRCGVEGNDSFLEVEDDGCGIAPDERERVRDRFYRGRSAQGQGSGLGLAIVERAAVVHAGSVFIGAGADGRGTRVRVSLRNTGSAWTLADDSAAP